jgi:hypothetical protein
MATARAVSTGGRISRGQAAGAFIPVVFGLVFIEANSGQLPRDWQAVVRPVGALVAVALIIGIARARRAAARTGTRPGPPTGNGRLRHELVTIDHSSATVSGLFRWWCGRAAGRCRPGRRRRDR